MRLVPPGVLLSDFETHNTGLYANYDDVGAYRLTFDSATLGRSKRPPCGTSR